MAKYPRVLTAALIGSLAIATAANAEDWHHGGDRDWHGGYNNGGAAGAAIVGGIVGLGLGAAIASNNGYYPYNGYYAAPPPVYYGAPSPYYYSAPPPVYYGY